MDLPRRLRAVERIEVKPGGALVQQGGAQFRRCIDAGLDHVLRSTAPVGFLEPFVE